MLLFPLKALLVLIGVAVPIAGFWVASSMAAHLNGPIWLVALCGLLICPLLPLVWEFIYAIQRKKYGERPSYGGAIAYSAFRNASRISGVLLVIAIIAYPKGVFTAVSTRGDWMVEGVGGPVVEAIERAVFWTADAVEWLEPDDNVFAQYDDSHLVKPARRGWRYDEDEDSEAEPEAPAPEPPPAPPARVKTPKRRRPVDSGVRAAPGARRRPDAGHAFADARSRRPAPPPRRIDAGQPAGSPDTGVFVDPESGVPLFVVRGKGDEPRRAPPEPKSPPRAAPRPRRRQMSRPERYAEWMMRSSPHDLATSMPAHAETDYRAVARYVADRVSDPFERMKAVHDYIALRVDYEADFDLANLPDSDPDVVFRRRVAVCSGYTRLFKAMAETIGHRSVYISGKSRFAVDRLPGTDHAWNAVQIEGDWYLIDLTWNAGYVEGRKFIKRYQTDYLFPPPEVFGLTHLPKDPAWQLVPTPVSRGEFLRQPLLWPRFFALGFELLDPTRSQVTIYDGQAEITVDNPREHRLLAKWYDSAVGPSKSGRCGVEYGADTVEAKCQLPSSGTYQVQLFGSMTRSQKHPLVGVIEVHNRI